MLFSSESGGSSLPSWGDLRFRGLNLGAPPAPWQAMHPFGVAFFRGSAVLCSLVGLTSKRLSQRYYSSIVDGSSMGTLIAKARNCRRCVRACVRACLQRIAPFLIIDRKQIIAIETQRNFSAGAVARPASLIQLWLPRATARAWT